MLKKSNLDLKNRALRLPNKIEIDKALERLLLKSLFFVFLLLWANVSQSIFAVIIYLITAFYFYFSPFSNLNIKKLFTSFLVVLIAPLFLSFYSLAYFSSLAFIWGIFFFIVFGIKDDIFKNSQLIYQILNNFLLFFLFIFLFSIDKSQFFLIKYIGFFIAAFFLIKEFFIWQFAELNIFVAAKINIFAAVMTLLIFQLAWVIMFLPIGFLNSAALMLVVLLMLKDLAIAYLNKSLDQPLIMKNITIILIFGLIIFMASRWQP